MPLFYFTFGAKYRDEPHPAGGHPDGWFTIEADDSNRAREVMFALCGPKWSWQYDSRPSQSLYRLGELKYIKA